MRKIVLTCLATTAITAVALFSNQAEGQSEENCSVVPLRSNALDDPGKHAWDIFVAINHPALDEATNRGEPDCTKKFGAPSSTSVWETWRNAETEVYLEDGAEPPDWYDNSLPDELPGQTPEATKLLTLKSFSTALFSEPEVKSDDETDSGENLSGFLSGEVSAHGFIPETSGFRPKFSPDGVFEGFGGIGETRMNKSTYDFVRDNCLFSRQGGQRYAQAVLDGKKDEIQFPVESVEAKALWIDFERENIPTDKWDTYYRAEYEGRHFGLAALHILTKDVPKWFWATFHHKDNPHNDFEDDIKTPPPSIVEGTVWENYQLGGVQTDFQDARGKPSILSDHYVEFGFKRSSCISCHATATISPTTEMRAAQPRSLCALNGSLPEMGLDINTCKSMIGAQWYDQDDKLISERGGPDPRWFEVDGKPYYLQTDFVYSIPFRGFRNDEQAPPPARCIW